MKAVEKARIGSDLIPSVGGHCQQSEPCLNCDDGYLLLGNGDNYYNILYIKVSISFYNISNYALKNL